MIDIRTRDEPVNDATSPACVVPGSILPPNRDSGESFFDGLGAASEVDTRPPTCAGSARSTERECGRDGWAILSLLPNVLWCPRRCAEPSNTRRAFSLRHVAVDEHLKCVCGSAAALESETHSSASELNV